MRNEDMSRMRPYEHVQSSHRRRDGTAGRMRIMGHKILGAITVGLSQSSFDTRMGSVVAKHSLPLASVEAVMCSDKPYYRSVPLFLFLERSAVQHSPSTWYTWRLRDVRHATKEKNVRLLECWGPWWSEMFRNRQSPIAAPFSVQPRIMYCTACGPVTSS